MFKALNGEMCDIGDEIRFCHGSGKCGGTTKAEISSETAKTVVVSYDVFWMQTGEREIVTGKCNKNKICCKNSVLAIDSNYVERFLTLTNRFGQEYTVLYNETNEEITERRRAFIESLRPGDWIVVRSTYSGSATQKPAYAIVTEINTAINCICYPNSVSNSDMSASENRHFNFYSPCIIAKCTPEYKNMLDEMCR